MEAPRTSADRHILTAETAVALLNKWLAARKCGQSGGLRALFAAAGDMAQDFDSPPSEISTRLLLWGFGRMDGSALDERESAAVVALHSFLEGKLDLRERRVTPHFGEPDDGREGSPAALTGNVQTLLDMAVKTALHRRPNENLVTVADVLLCFPPDRSKAEAWLLELGIKPRELRAAIEARLGEAAPAPGFNDSVATHADEPATIDLLERAPFAAVLARNIREARTSGESEASAFVVHLHGPRGSGKSSVLNFLEAELKEEKPPWLVVRFNAWRDQRRQPPWWSLITCIYASASNKLDEHTSNRLWWRWFKWRVRADFMPWIVTGTLVLGFAVLLILGLTSSIGPTVSAIGGALTLIGAGVVAVRSLALGSQRAAQTYADLKADPFQPMTTLFDRLIAAIDRPVAVFIDDLDRCDGGYVVDLLEGIQTLMRSAPVTYVVAADRKWICSSFEQRYAKFSPPIGEPGRPLGYLFLDKMFQISAAVPQLAADVRASYWESLLSESSSPRGPADEIPAGEDAGGVPTKVRRRSLPA